MSQASKEKHLCCYSPTLEVYLITHILAYTCTYNKISSKTSAVGQFAMRVKFYQDDKKKQCVLSRIPLFFSTSQGRFSDFFNQGGSCCNSG